MSITIIANIHEKSDYGGYIFDTLVLVVLLEVRFGAVRLKRGAFA